MSADPIDEDAERLFASARREGASERLVQRVLSDMASVTGQRAPSSRRASPRSVRSLRPLSAALLAAAACGVAAITWSTLASSPSAPPISAEVERRQREPRRAQNVKTEATPAPAIPPAPAVTPEPGRMQHAERQSEPVAPSATPRRPASRRTPEGSQSRGPSTPLVPATQAAAPLPPPGSTVVRAPDVRDVAETRAVQPSLSDELQALERARAALRGGDGRAALRLLDDGGAARFSRLAAEATLLRIEALYAVGELSESRRVAEAFTTENPDSHLGDRARSFIRQIDASRNTAGSSPR